MNAFKKNNFNTILIIVLILVNLVSLYFMLFSKGMAFNKPHSRHERQVSDRAMNFLRKELNLNDKQVAEFKIMKHEHHQGTKKTNERIKDLHDVLFENIGNDEFKVEAIADSIAVYHKRVEIETYEHFKALRKLCTTEQQQKFDVVIKELMRSMGPPSSNRPPRGKPF